MDSFKNWKSVFIMHCSKLTPNSQRQLMDDPVLLLILLGLEQVERLPYYGKNCRIYHFISET